MKKVKKPIVIYPRGTVQRISASMGIPQRSVLAALKFETNSQTSKDIRNECVKNYGGRLSEVSI